MTCASCNWNIRIKGVFAWNIDLNFVSIILSLQPFYGGKRDQLSAELFTPEKKSFCTIKGEWNGIMWARHVQGVGTRALCT